MTKVKVLSEGWARKKEEVWDAVCNTVLIDTGRKKVIVDPGNHPKLLDMMERKAIWPEEIDTIFITHSHLDHMKNIGLFPFAEVVDNHCIHRGTVTKPHDGFIPGTDIRIIPTPGHTSDHASVQVETYDGVVMICGDLFWWEDGLDIRTDRVTLMSLPDEFAEDRSTLLRYRAEALKSGTSIFIPGHGSIFEVVSQDL